MGEKRGGGGKKGKGEERWGGSHGRRVGTEGGVRQGGGSRGVVVGVGMMVARGGDGGLTERGNRGEEVK